MQKMTIRAIRSVVGAAVVVAASAAVVGGTSTSAQANERYCDEQAQEYASYHTRRGGGTVGGALVGGSVGAIIGKVVGGNTGAGVGALVGGSTGAIVGTDRENRRYEALYNKAYTDCMQEVSYRQDRPRPQRVQAGAYEPWTDEWYDYCAAKYRSFNPQTGEFLSYSGEYKMCR